MPTPSLYGFLLGTGFVLAALLAEYIANESWNHRSKKPFLTTREWTTLLTAIFVGGAIGARLYHLVTDWPLYAQQPWWQWLAVWHGGLGILGGLAGGVLAGLLWYHWAKPAWPRLLLLDAISVSLPFGQAVGRWGNYFNHELFGPPTQLPWGIFIPQSLRPENFSQIERFHPLFLYESIGMLALGLFLLQLWKLGRTIPKVSWLQLGSGLYMGLYALCFGMLRFCLDFLRLDLTPALWGLTWSQVGIQPLDQLPYLLQLLLVLSR